jgi:pyruvate dehydrogenase E2 component (dihydrolipoamide acetyltransferase)
MAEVVPMPKLGFDMAEGTLVKRVKREGDAVAKGEIIAEVETDKATVEVEAYLGGVIKGWVINEGETVPVGSPMVVIGEASESVDVAGLTGKTPAGAPAPAGAAPASNGAPAPAPTAAAEPAVVAATTDAGRVMASPIARKLAADAGVDLRGIQGSGPHGRVVKRDVEMAVSTAPKPTTAAASPAPAPRPAAVAPPVVTAEDQVVPLTKLRNIIARRMVESTTSVPAIYLTIEVDMAAALSLRKQINALLPDERRASVNDFVLKAAALALRQFPNLNASFGGDKIIRHGHVNVGFAVAVEAGLLTVVTRDTDVKSVTQIAVETKPMIARARDGKVQPADIEGSTFTVSNLGMYDIEHFTAIINLPEAAILAVGATKEVPVVKDGALAVGQRMKMTCAADHRVTDGAEVAQFLQAIKKGLEEPLRLLV